MDRRERREKRVRGTPRKYSTDVGSASSGLEIESSAVGSGSTKIPISHARCQDDLKAQIVDAIKEGFLAAGQDRGSSTILPKDVGDQFGLIFDSFRRLEPPRFKGGSLEAAEEWLASVKAKFRICRAPEVDQVELATHYLENSARLWWENTKLEFDGDHEKISWEWFEEKFKEEYIGELQQELMREQFVNLKQENQTVAEYNSQFVNLSHYAPDIRADAHRYRRHYISGLRPRIAGMVDDPAVRDLRKLMNYAVQIEVHHNREDEENQEKKVSHKSNKGQPSSRGSGEMYGISVAPKIKRKERQWCRKCKKSHLESRCRFFNKTCFVCGSSDHWKRDCPSLSELELSKKGVPSSSSMNVVRKGVVAANWCMHCNKNHAESNCRHLNKACFKCGNKGHWLRDCTN